jgi:hypothetical protein
MEANIDFGSDNGQGSVGGFQIVNGKLDPGRMRPYAKLDQAGNPLGTYVTCYKGIGSPEDAANYHEQMITNAFHVNDSTLRPTEWRQLDQAIVPEAQTRLGGIADLVANGLVYNLGNAMGTTVLEWHDQSGIMEADVTMDGITRGKNNRPVYGVKYLPIPIIHVDYEIGARALAASRGLGNPLDTTDAAMARRAVDLKLEQMLFSDVSYTYGSGTISSYVNYTDKDDVILTKHWDASGKTGAEILADVQSMKAAAVASLHFGPFMLYIPTAYEAVLDNDYSSSKGTNTIRERILQLPSIKGIKTIDTLAADNVLLVQMTSDVVRLVQGMGIQNVQWGVEGNMITKFKVMTIQVPQIRSDHNGKTGIVHLAPV